MKIFVADDAALMREGLIGLLGRAGFEVVGQADSAPELLSGVRAAFAAGEQIDLVLTDVRMPPNLTDDGLRAAAQLRAEFPALAIMVLSQYVAPAYASVLFAADGGGPAAGGPVPGRSTFSGGIATPAKSAGLGYLLKERVSRVADFAASLRMVANGGVVIDPEVATQLIRGRSMALASLTPREREVLELMATGLSNAQIQERMFLSAAAVSKHVSNVFTKLGLLPGEENRRVRAVLKYLTETGIN
ncbi:response regulator transcription factor [Boudabousia marimammalium]|uniref:DNA-binding response regulator n=1 Tax=Boudabousia marimammalium TaxID=156892 RepID=A0A1Q5PSN4_9ACTO|nr:response regulator transcription factor [Boudabousia marimammalium]OKL50420.1 DNA-binding response regulator [Boudabousia marimammalium]